MDWKILLQNKNYSISSISGHFNLDRKFFLYLKNNIKTLFNRNDYLKEKPKSNCIELQFSSKTLFPFLEETLNLPVGKKKGRSEERREGKECRSRWSPYH